MRDLLSDIEAGSTVDPVKRARALSRRELPKRFYKEVQVARQDDGLHAVQLDGRPVKTTGRNLLALAEEEIARGIAGEWDAQGKEIDPATMPLTRIANVAIDAVPERAGEVADDVAAYAGNDLLFYRAETPQSLVERQNAIWGPVLSWAEARFGGRFVLAEGVMPVRQDAALLARIREALSPLAPLPLAALHVATTLSGSALLALALMEGELSADEAWAAAFVDEDWNIEHWGEDPEAAALRASRRRDFDAAALILNVCAGRGLD
ncbi:ATP12 family chaperone protein [Stappia sp. 28M-7]|uniref:ATP12 family chaperone protein n=1 Tax=Stappia sp. 28M-7 TaxID=2762596 RepID=UPI00163D30EA|nr:ATP12 family protein [Stappia sp. 28M-7]MBC2860108.1 ATPase [Stappia sp. 28M-7]